MEQLEIDKRAEKQLSLLHSYYNNLSNPSDIFKCLPINDFLKSIGDAELKYLLCFIYNTKFELYYERDIGLGIEQEDYSNLNAEYNLYITIINEILHKRKSAYTRTNKII